MKKVLNSIPELLLIISAFLLIGAVYLWAPVCSKFLELNTGKFIHMKCYYTSVASVLMAIIMLGLAVESFITKKKSFIVPIIMGILLMIMIKDTPLSLGVCKMKTMSCQETKIWITISGIISILSGISGWSLMRKDKPLPPQLD